MKQLTKRLYNWATVIDDATTEQSIETANMPMVFPHVALMPDAHLGKGCSIGSVIPTVGAVMPAAVGVDLGCGMTAVKLDATADQFTDQNLADIRGAIESRIPMSAGKYHADLLNGRRWHRTQLLEAQWPTSSAVPYAGSWKLQLGTLGGGNHFIEVVKDVDDAVWIFLHSGSRGIGNKIAQHHISTALEYCDRNFIKLPHPDLAYLVEGTAEFDQYIAEASWAQDFAKHNRATMSDLTLDAVRSVMGSTGTVDVIDVHHNFVQKETHFGREVYVTRKGAVFAGKGSRGLIPGSMGTCSYVFEGLGNKMALNSAPHGAGRAMSRRQARKTFDSADLEAAMTGIEYRKSDALIDEHPGAYRNIDQVMVDAKSLVKITNKFTQMLNCKGD